MNPSGRTNGTSMPKNTISNSYRGETTYINKICLPPESRFGSVCYHADHPGSVKYTVALATADMRQCVSDL